MIDSHLLTVCLVIHNEEKHLPRCLKSVKDVSKNIFVIHDGPCSDDSLKICKSFGCMVVVREHLGEAELHRAWQYSQVKTKWILQLDADEFLSDEFVHHLDEILAQDANGYTCIWPIWDGSSYITKNWPRKMILFQREKAKFIAAPHEAAQVPEPIIHTPYLLEHRPNYNNLTWHSFRTKWMRWAKIHSRCYLTSSRPVTFGYKSDEEVRVHYYTIMQYPLFALFAIPIWHFLGNVWYGSLKEGIPGLKSTTLMSAYYGIVAWHVLIARTLAFFAR